MGTKSFSFIGRAIARMAVVLAIGFAAPAQASPLPGVGQSPAAISAQTDLTQVAWREHRRDGYRRYGYRHHRRGYDGLDVLGAFVGGAFLADDRYGDRYYQHQYYHRPHRNWAPEGWPRN